MMQAYRDIILDENTISWSTLCVYISRNYAYLYLAIYHGLEMATKWLFYSRDEGTSICLNFQD
jgi:hypothetical protein